jgi:hypothetical protein
LKSDIIIPWFVINISNIKSLEVSSLEA